VGVISIVFFFLASYLLTLRWYERLGSTPALLLGAVAQPLFTAVLFSFGMAFCAQFMHDDGLPDSGRVFRSTLRASALFTIVIAVPLALLAAIPSQRRIRAQPPKEFYDSLEGFEVLVVIGVISSLCAALAVGSFGLLVWFVVA